MTEKKVTEMVIKTDLSCNKCRTKIKKVLCRIPEIQNQIYDDKANTVTITVVCCCPEKIKKKICCKGGESVDCIEIRGPPKPNPPDQKPKDEDKQKPDKQTDKKPADNPVVEPPKKTPTPPPGPVPGVRTCCRECYEGYRGPCYGGYHGILVPCYVGYGKPVYDFWGCGGGYVYYGCRRGCCAGRCDCADYSSSCCVM